MLNCPGCWTPSSDLAQVLMVAANTERSATRMMLGWSVWSQIPLLALLCKGVPQSTAQVIVITQAIHRYFPPTRLLGC